MYIKVQSQRYPAVSEFMSQKLDLIKLHGIMGDLGEMEGARSATGVSPRPTRMKGERHESQFK